MFKYRIISFPLLLALVAAVFFWKEGGRYLFALIAVAGCGAALYEGAALAEKINIKNSPLFCAVSGALVSAAYCIDRFGWINAQLCGTVTGLLIILTGISALLVMIAKKNDIVQKIAGSIGIFAIFGIPFLLLETIYFRTLGGLPLLLYVICVVKSMDTGGYIFGLLSNKFMPNGNHKIVPSISPKKSWEGFFGGIAFSVGVALLLWKFGMQPFTMGVWMTVISGVVLALGSFDGDLTESALKRAAGIKDSGSIIPGMGGVFDVLDSFIFNGMLFSILWYISKINMQ